MAISTQGQKLSAKKSEQQWEKFFQFLNRNFLRGRYEKDKQKKLLGSKERGDSDIMYDTQKDNIPNVRERRMKIKKGVKALPRFISKKFNLKN